MMRRLLAMIALLAVPLFAQSQDKPTVVELWPGKAPGETKDLPPEASQEQKPGQRQVNRLGNITKPQLHVYKPAKDKDTGTAIVIAPGGGYSILAWDHEGEEVAKWLTTIGVTGIVLKYRVPRRPGEPTNQPPLTALMDAQRAIRLARAKASEWGYDAKKVGMLGFSAGGHLTAWTATNPDLKSYEPFDDSDKLSAKPDFLALIYPAYLVKNEKKDEFAPEIKWTKDSPPTFFAHAYDDPVTPESSVRSFLLLKQLKVPAELHVYTAGGHGYGIRDDGKPVNTWPARLGDWLGAQGYLKK